MDALNLFSTMWGLIESPSATFKKIVLSRHKNYVVLLGMLFGVSLTLDVIWYVKLGTLILGLGAILGAATVVGPFIGMGLLSVGAFIVKFLTRPIGGIATTRNMWAALSYATMPMVIALVFLAPVELAIFGKYFFGVNPPPSVIKPTEYSVILGLKGAVFLHWFFLSVVGVMAANAFKKGKALPVALILLGLAALVMIGVNYVAIPTR